MGAEATIAYEEEDLKARAREISGGGVDVVIDPVGGRHSEAALRATGHFGRFCVIGFASGPIASVPLNQVLLNNRTVIGVDWGGWTFKDPLGNRTLIDEIIGDGRHGQTPPGAPGDLSPGAGGRGDAWPDRPVHRRQGRAGPLTDSALRDRRFIAPGRRPTGGTHSVEDLTAPPPWPRRWAGVTAVLAAFLLIGAAAGCSESRNAATTTATKPAPADRAAKAGVGSPGASTSGSSPPSGPSWSLVTEPGDGMQPIYSLMSGARVTLDMTMYELDDPTTVSILEADARRGVRVRVLLDQDYSGQSINQPDFSQLASNGVQVHWAPAGTIFHQKTVTIDDRTSAVMTLNLTSEYYSTTRDFAVITDDQPDVAAVEQVFDADWTNPGAPATGPTGQNLVWSPGAEAAVLSVIDSAQHSLLVENEEMDDPDITKALESAAGRGVDVDVVMTYSSSWADAFNDLTNAGVHVRTYSPDASLYIHAKVVVADGTTLFLGSQNFSAASLDYNRELGIITTDASLVGSVDHTVTSDFAGATVFVPPTASPATTPATDTGPTTPSSGAWCQASASPADDGYSGDYNVDITSNQPDTRATASDSSDTWSDEANGSGSVVMKLYHTSPGQSITVTVGAATCSTTA